MPGFLTNLAFKAQIFLLNNALIVGVSLSTLILACSSLWCNSLPSLERPNVEELQIQNSLSQLKADLSMASHKIELTTEELESTIDPQEVLKLEQNRGPLLEAKKEEVNSLSAKIEQEREKLVIEKQIADRQDRWVKKSQRLRSTFTTITVGTLMVVGVVAAIIDSWK
jgi:hypothetical protein